MAPSISRAMERLNQQEQEVVEERERSTQYRQAAWTAYERAKSRDEKVQAVADEDLKSIAVKREELNILFGSKSGRNTAEVRDMIRPLQLQIVEEAGGEAQGGGYDTAMSESPVVPKSAKPQPPKKAKKKGNAKEPEYGVGNDENISEQPKTTKKGRTMKKPKRLAQTTKLFNSKEAAAARARSKQRAASSDDADSDVEDFQIQRQRSLSTHSEIIVADRRWSENQHRQGTSEMPTQASPESSLPQESEEDNSENYKSENAPEARPEAQPVIVAKNASPQQDSDRESPEFQNDDTFIFPEEEEGEEEESFGDVPSWSFPPDEDEAPPPVTEERPSDSMAIDAPPESEASPVAGRKRLRSETRSVNLEDGGADGGNAGTSTPGSDVPLYNSTAGVVSPPPIEWPATSPYTSSGDPLLRGQAQNEEAEGRRRSRSSSSGLFVRMRTPTPPPKRKKKNAKGGQAIDIGAAIFSETMSKYQK